MAIVLEEFDPIKTAIIEPEMVAAPIEGFPEVVISCFSYGLLQKFVKRHRGVEISHLETEDGGTPVYRIEYQGMKAALYMSRVGAPACVIQFEEMIAKGAKKFLLLGCCGVLDGAIPGGSIILPTAAVRDEGVSYHYLPAADEIRIDPEMVELLKATFDELQYPYVCGKTWTTDAIYRETVAKTQKRKDQGCIAVDMECASMHAVAQFRGVTLAQFFYTEDNLDGGEWEPREIGNQTLKQDERFLQLAFACALKLTQMVDGV